MSSAFRAVMGLLGAIRVSWWQMRTLSRRSALELAGFAATGAWIGARANARSIAVTPALRAADYPEVRLHESPLLAQFEAQHATLLALDEDALLKPFREAGGLPAPGADLGGWYNAASSFDPPRDMHGFIPGHSFGQYLSALARAYAITGHEATRQKVQRLVAAFAPTITSRFYDGYPLPAYTYDKLSIGLLDAHAFAHDDRALETLNRALDAALPHLPARALTRPQMAARPHPNIAYTWDESYTLPENFYLAWRRGAGERHRLLARRFLLDRDYFDPLARGENVLAGRHAYSHVNALSSAMQAYLVDGDARHLLAAENGLGFVEAQSFATGGWGPNEAFVPQGSDELGESLHTTHASFETPCGAYGHFKLVRYLVAATGKSRYGDGMERVLYNAILGALPMRPDGTSFYYSDYNESGSRKYFEYRCPCCSGTLGQVLADYGISAFLVSHRGACVNLYAPSELRWDRNGRPTSLTVATGYPLTTSIAIAVGTATPDAFSVALRIPAWAGPRTELAINGKRLEEPIAPGAFHELHRTWTEGDRIELALHAPLRLQAVDERHPDLVAATQGPLALFAVGERFLPFTRQALLGLRQVAAGGSEWRCATADGVQTFRPFFAVGSSTTRLYQPLSG
ncbi:MAG: beta-L-arabinofuranosidase domain-containing protein [Steroidobacteraceae bacterium]